MRDEFMITRQGKQYVLYQGLLDEAHARGLRGIDTELMQVPTAENGNVALVKAIVDMEDDRAFSGIGDASPENVSRNIVPHIIRMAETRAKARALRDAVNVGATALEELSDGDVEGPPPNNVTRHPRAAEPPPDEPPPDDPHEHAKQGGGSNPKQAARKSQIDLLRTLAEELRGENGVQRLEEKIGKSLGQLSRAEADEWIDKLTPQE